MLQVHFVAMACSPFFDACLCIVQQCRFYKGSLTPCHSERLRRVFEHTPFGECWLSNETTLCHSK